MPHSPQSDTRQSFLEQMQSHLADHPRVAADFDKVLQFLKIYYAYLSVEDLFSRPLESWAELLLDHWELLNASPASFFNLRIAVSEDGFGMPLTQIYMTSCDMPFLVDSLSLELSRLHLNVDLLLHSAGFRVTRSDDNAVKQIWSYQEHSQEGQAEAILYFEIKKALDEEALAHVKTNLERVLNDVYVAVDDWHAMQGEAHRAIARLDNAPSCLDRDKVEEAKAFLSWLLSDNFVFTGYRSYDVIGEGDSMAFQLNPNTGLGVLRDNTNSLRLRYVQDLPKQARQKLLSSDDIVLVAKTNTISTIHRKTYTDYVSVSLYNDEKQVIGELRFIGMFTSHAYAQDPKKVPILQRKVFNVLGRADFPKHGHLWKDLVHIISSLPRDDLFHASTDELNGWCQGILKIQDRYKTRFFYRQDVYNRFYSCLLFIPRDTLSMSLIYRIRDHLKDRLNAKSIEHQTFLFGSVLARIHFEIRVDPAALVDIDMKAIEAEIASLTASWGDQLSEAIIKIHSPLKSKRLVERYRQAFGITYREHYTVEDAVVDFEYIEKVLANNTLEAVLVKSRKSLKSDDGKMLTCQFKLYSESVSVPLSQVLPILEGMGVRVLSEFPVDVHVSSTQVIWINDFTLTSDSVSLEELFEAKELFEEAFKRVSSGYSCSDSLNALIGKAGMSWRFVRVIRAYIRYCRQIRVPYSEAYMANILIRYPAIVKSIVQLFMLRFAPNFEGNREEEVAASLASIDEALANIALLDEDRVLRKMLELVQATLRTNIYLTTDKGEDKLFLTLKIDPKQLSDMAGCKTKIETFIFSVMFEGIHLRVDKVARGGIRWSSRPEDYRTEVLGLVEAQLVKNAVIVPAGAKGGFVIHRSEDSFTTDELWAHGIRCYRYFIRGLLDVIDDLKDGKVVHNPKVICYDGDDPLAVVAADRRTATFSDYANEESESQHYWLGDAFASGGSNGYDHKKMGITARGAWVSAQRHFLEMGINLDESEVTVVAIGDMSGDVFGNGMLLSRHIKLVAAFNHRHIFLDPNPDPARSFEERERLFKIARSGWNDYDASLISSGGGVFNRSQKSINLTPEVKEMLGVSDDTIEPNALIRQLLCLDVDMLWNGGIGTYVKASKETHDDVGDRANDALRVNARDLRSKTVCEGGNLGLTQPARIEYELHKGRVYSDFIDNSAGVDCSDHEVNIKILLNGLVSSGEMTKDERNILLESMSDEVAAHVLRNNYLQGMAVSDIKRHVAKSPIKYGRYMQSLQQAGVFNLEAESLPDEATLMMRQNQGLGLMHPEISTLFAYTKISVGNELRQEDLLANPDLTFYLLEAFPKAIRDNYPEELKTHYLANEIIATQLVNELVANMGLLFVNQMIVETGVTSYAVAKAYVAMAKIIHLPQRLAEVESLDHKVSAELQFDMRSDVVCLARRMTRWILRHHGVSINISELVEAYEGPIGFLTHHLDSLVFKSSDKAYMNRAKRLENSGVAEDVARHMSALVLIYHGMNIIAAAMQQENYDLLVVAKAYVLLSSRLDLVFLREKINSIAEDTEWSLTARSCCKVDLEVVQRFLVLELLKNGTKGAPIEDDFEVWVKLRKDDLKAWRERMKQLKQMQTVDSAIIFLAIRQLKEFAAKETA